ncbi:MAG: sialidase family protein, partial [Armatimonadota bacterium]|nr:sialidase family protein [Armatimonadota bacterium]
VCFLRFENILTEADPEKLVVTTWPKTPHGLSAPNPFRPGINTAQEPTNPSLSDGRLICVMRTLLGRIYFALSEDDGRTWDEPRPLLYEPSGQPILNPMAPCPLYKLKDGRFLLLFFNNDGSGHGGSGPTDSKNVRNPAWITIGKEIPGEKKHPIRFGKPKVFASTDWTPISGTDTGTQVATYTSLVEDKGERILFYPDRKHFLLGKYLTDEWLADCDPDIVGVGP